MTIKGSKPTGRKQRSDAQQNRERILTIAREVFSRSGANASLEEIAKKARVGIGTLYRHFPSREELLKAVYKAGVEKLAKAGPEFAETLPPVEALRSWMLLYVDFIAEKRIIAAALTALIDDPKNVFEPSHAQIRNALQALIKRAVKSGNIRDDLDAIDLLLPLIGIASVAIGPDWQKGARKLVDILISGSRPVNQR